MAAEEVQQGMALNEYAAYIAENKQRYIDELSELLRIPSISTLADHKGDVRRAAEWVAEDLRQSGVENVRVIGTQGHPLVYGDWLHAPGAPTLLLYAHFDVQPADPLDEWLSPPFEPTVRDGNIYARGAADDKGQLFIQLKVAEMLLRDGGKLPINVRFLFEGEEESGGESIEAYVRQEAEALKCDAVLISDSGLFAEGIPAIEVGLRGMVYTEISVRGAAHDLHSGMYGGAAPNAINALALIISRLKDEQGKILVPGFYDRVREITPEEKAQWAALPFDEEEFRKHEVGSPQLTGEPGFTVIERIGARPTLDCHGIIGGFVADGAKTVIPAVARCKISMRLVADQDPKEIYKLFREHVEASCPPYATVEVWLIHDAEPVLLATDNVYMQASAEALKEAFGRETVFSRSGGSIPIVSLFGKSLNAPSVLMGFGLPDDNLHAPNEKMKIDNIYKGIEAIARYFDLLAEQTKAD